MEILEYLCPGEKVLIWIYKKYGNKIKNYNKDNIYYILYIEYLRDINVKDRKIEWMNDKEYLENTITISLKYLTNNSIKYILNNISYIIEKDEHLNYIKNNLIGTYFNNIENDIKKESEKLNIKKNKLVINKENKLKSIIKKNR